MSRKRKNAANVIPNPMEPDLKVLKTDFQYALSKRDSNVFKRQRVNMNSRYCVWANQSNDGRKWKAPKGEDVFPWPGASDARVHLIDKYINEDAALLLVTLKRMKILVAGTESNDAKFANRCTHILRWMLRTQIGEAFRESRMLANLLLERGAVIMGVFWERQQQLAYDTIDLETIQSIVMDLAQKDPNNPMVNLPAMILNPDTEEAATDLATQFYPELPRSRMRKVIVDLRTTGAARFPRPYTIKDRPTFVALSISEDIFIPPECTDLENASALHRRELLTDVQLRERVQSHGWDKEWVEDMIETQRGIISTDTETLNTRYAYSERINARGILATERLFEVIHSYRRLSDEEGVPGIYYTCWNPHITESFAYHDILNYDHGQYPFILIKREYRSRLPEDSRGYGEIAFTWQQQIKIEWDGRIDRASIATLPPSHYPPGMAPDKWGPGVQVPTMRPEAYGFMAVPNYDQGSAEIEASVRRFADEYFGRPVDEQNVTQAQIVQQSLVETWLDGWQKILTQTFQLMQQFLPDQFYYRVVGSQQGQSIHASREEIQGQFDVSVTFNSSDIDTEAVAAKLGFLEKAIAMDAGGVIDRTEALTVAFEIVDPNLGERLLRPAEAATQHEIEDEQLVFAKMMAGIGTDIKPGQAYQLRLQTLQNIMQQNPDGKKRYVEDPHFKMLLENRAKQLTQQVTQQQNKIVGKLGASPVGMGA